MIVDIDKILLIGPMILLERTNINSKTKGGIIIPGAKETQFEYGIIVKIGTGVEFSNEAVKERLKIGETVLYSRSAQKMELPLQDAPKEYVFANYDRNEIIGVL